MEIVKGQSATIDAVIYSDVDAQTLADISGAASFYFMVKKATADSDANAKIVKTPSVKSLVTSEVTVSLSGAETDTLVPGKYCYEIVAKLADGKVIRSGYLELSVLKNVIKSLT